MRIQGSRPHVPSSAGNRATLTLQRWRGEAFNFSYEQPITVLDLVRRILALMESPLEPEIRNEATHEIRAQYLSAAKARSTLGWHPLLDLDQGLVQTIAWYRDFFAGLPASTRQQRQQPEGAG